LRALFRKERIESELDEELRGFLEMAAEEKMKQGMRTASALGVPTTFGLNTLPACSAVNALCGDEGTASRN
jgi:hypothetical protein